MTAPGIARRTRWRTSGCDGRRMERHGPTAFPSLDAMSSRRDAMSSRRYRRYLVPRDRRSGGFALEEFSAHVSGLHINLDRAPGAAVCADLMAPDWHVVGAEIQHGQDLGAATRALPGLRHHPLHGRNRSGE